MGGNTLTTRKWLWALVEPALILKMAMSYYISTNIRTMLRGNILAPLLNAHQLRDEAFGRFWVAFSSNREEPQDSSAKPESEPDSESAQVQVQDASAALSTSTPTPEPKEVTCSTDLIPPILSHASGVVLDVGPGTGTQMPLLKSPNISAIYGAEPCIGLHAELKKRAEKEGLGCKYTILPCGVEKAELEKEMGKVGLRQLPSLTSGPSNAGGGEGVFDTIITIRVLCSVPDLSSTISDLYTLLKPGGKLLVVEHVVNPWRTDKGSILARAMQRVYHAFGWRWVMGDCSLDRDTEGVIRGLQGDGDGGKAWESVDVERWFESTCMVYVAGVFTKRG
ncbi:class I SAM-dependent methyltransferase [Aspergillus undulatus]|uniref:class I SAM-dependent methyltransferase n=1 Tax=Aspergillus undulatus TaxID=1810928 RepID=UPI003CCCF371